MNVGCTKGDHLEFEFVTTLYEDDNGNLNDGAHPGPESDTNTNSISGADSFDDNIMIRDMYYIIWENSEQVGNEQWLIDEYLPTSLGDLTYHLSDLNDNGYMDLEDMETLGIDNVPPPEIDTGGVGHEVNFLEFCFIARFNPDAGNDLQGDICTLDLIVTLNQDPSQ